MHSQSALVLTMNARCGTFKLYKYTDLWHCGLRSFMYSSTAVKNLQREKFP